MKTILIVEDSELNIDLLVQILEDDYTLVIARDGAEGIASVEKDNPDLVLMDISLPVMDGLEAARMIRKRYKELPVIGLSAHAMQGDKEEALAAGCNDYLTKPIDEDILLSKLASYLGGV
ncbi:MAG TPA: response regulator [Anaerolineaceae bacterium]|nr:response regulator [Anaerolineaceae bacterium]